MGKSFLYIAGFGIIGLTTYAILKQIEKMSPLQKLKDLSTDFWSKGPEKWQELFEELGLPDPGNPEDLPLSTFGKLAQNEEFLDRILERNLFAPFIKTMIMKAPKHSFCVGPFCF